MSRLNTKAWMTGYGLTSSSESILWNALISKPLLMVMQNTVRFPFVPQNKSSFNTFKDLVADENAHLQRNKSFYNKQQTQASRTKQFVDRSLFVPRISCPRTASLLGRPDAALQGEKL
jgi:hypothetical protein